MYILSLSDYIHRKVFLNVQNSCVHVPVAPAPHPLALLSSVSAAPQCSGQTDGGSGGGSGHDVHQVERTEQQGPLSGRGRDPWWTF